MLIVLGDVSRSEEAKSVAPTVVYILDLHPPPSNDHCGIKSPAEWMVSKAVDAAQKSKWMMKSMHAGRARAVSLWY